MHGSRVKLWLVKIMIIFMGLLVAGRVWLMCCRMAKSLVTRRSVPLPPANPEGNPPDFDGAMST